MVDFRKHIPPYGPRLVSTGIPDLVPMVRTGRPQDHISYVLREICIALGHYEAEDDDTMTAEENALRQTRWEMGSAFENALIQGLRNRYAESDPGRYVTPGELELEGLLGSPDLCDVRDEVVHEIKFTWMSSRHDAESEKFWKYWKQGMTYAHMMGWQTVRLHVGHIMGDYRRDGKGPSPIYNVWEQRFSKEDLANNWRMIKSHHRKAAVK